MQAQRWLETLKLLGQLLPVYSFRDSVDDYLDFCAEQGENPDKPFSGKFVLRMNPELHHAIHLKAIKAGKSLNKWVIDTLQSA